MNYLITGFPGMGKSTIAAELKRRGHIAYDPQTMRLMHVESRLTGKHIQPPEQVPHDWYDAVGAYNWDPVKISRLLSEPGDVFICSLAHNQYEFYNRFKLIFVLTLDPTELENRLLNRPGQTIGKSPSELADIMSKHESFEQSILNHGAIRLNAALPISETVDKILDHVRDSSAQA